MSPLKLPLTIRTARQDELPVSDYVLEKFEKRTTTKIVEGYTIAPNQTNGLPFNFYAEINVDNDRLWTLFVEVLLSFPDEVCFRYADADEEVSFGEYRDKFDIMNKISPYELELTQDGMLELEYYFLTRTSSWKCWYGGRNIYNYGVLIKINFSKQWRCFLCGKLRT